jgi:hypothetical protein
VLKVRENVTPNGPNRCATIRFFTSIDIWCAERLGTSGSDQSNQAANGQKVGE